MKACLKRITAALILLLLLCGCTEKIPAETEAPVIVPPGPGETLPLPETRSPETAAPVTEPPATEPPETEPPADPVPAFKADLSAYEAYMAPADRDGYLLLVNKTHPIDADSVPADLTYLPQEYAVYSGEWRARMTSVAAGAYTAMLTELSANGYTDVKATLAYRSYATQSYLYNNYIAEEMAKNPALSKEEARAIVETYSAPPGTSEHQTGLCTDMHNVYNRPDLELEDFEKTDAYLWLRDNCWKFGFILRFPRGKEEITGYQFECWHFRFVGRYHAKRIFDSGLCLEEYLEKLQKN